MSRYPKTASRHVFAASVVAFATVCSLALPAFAQDTAAAPASTPDKNASRTPPPTGTLIRKPNQPVDLGVVHVGGAALRSGDAKWTDDDRSAPELPMTREPGAASH